MILYWAGNFPQLSDIRKERAFTNRLIKEHGRCNRLISFYYLKEAETVLKIKKELTTEKEVPPALDHIKKPTMSKRENKPFM